MNETAVVIASLVCVTVVLIAVIVAFGRLKIEQQRTLQRLLDKDEVAPEDWERIVGSPGHKNQDLRRGALLVTAGLTFGAFLFMIGGSGWMLAIVPVAVGLVYLLFSRLNGSKSGASKTSGSET